MIFERHAGAQELTARAWQKACGPFLPCGLRCRPLAARSRPVTQLRFRSTLERPMWRVDTQKYLSM